MRLSFSSIRLLVAALPLLLLPGASARAGASRRDTMPAPPRQTLPFRTLGQAAPFGEGSDEPAVYLASQAADVAAFDQRLVVEHRERVLGVDFSDQIVVAVFAATAPSNGYDIAVQQLSMDANRLRIVVVLRGPRPDVAVLPALTRPYHVVQMSRAALEGATPTAWSLFDQRGRLLAESALDARCFAETGACIGGRLRAYWEQNGGLPVFGFPITPVHAIAESAGQTRLVQWFERNRLELHPSNPAPYDVLLGRLGDDRLRQDGVEWQALPRADGPKPGCLWFEQTSHNVCDLPSGPAFKTYWQTHGLEFDGRRGTSFDESLALFGLPLSEPQMVPRANGEMIMSQWFERARFEWHPQNPEPFKLLLGRLGAEVRGRAGNTAPLATSGITGLITLGPLCPVERIENPCPDRPYQASVTVEQAQSGRPVTELTSGLDGRFVVALARGDYRLVPRNPDGRALPRAEPVSVTVPPGSFVEVLIAFDTGIR